MITLMAPLNLIDATETATRQTLTELNTLVRMAHSPAEHKLQYRHTQDCMFASFLNAAWSTSPRLGKSVRALVHGHGSLTLEWSRSTVQTKSADTAKFSHGSRGVREVQKIMLPLKPKNTRSTHELCGMRWMRKVTTTLSRPSSTRLLAQVYFTCIGRLQCEPFLDCHGVPPPPLPAPSPPRLLRSVRVCSAHTQTLTVLTDSTYHEVWYSLNCSFRKQLTSRGSRLWTV